MPPPGTAPASASFFDVPLGTGAAARFLRRRLRLHLALVAVLSGSFLAVNTTLGVLTNRELLFEHVMHAGNLLHLGQVVCFVCAWIAVVMLELEERSLYVLDAAAAVIGLGLLEGMAAVRPTDDVFLLTLLCFVSITLSRAIFVPSSALRTAWVSAASAVPVLVISASAGGEGALGRTAYGACWILVAAAIATTASRIIFGLTQRVRQARQLGQYTLHDRLGGGGMGDVYRAQHAMLRRPTAIKLLRPETVGEDNVARFEREVRLTARLAHPNTIAIYDYGRTPDGIFYYAMELLDGVDLQRLVDEHGPMPGERVVYLLEQVCASLAEAHELGLIHRDVKPANIVVCKRARAHDVVKVLDFGLAKNVQDDAEVAVSKANTIAGTPLYLAPETILGDAPVDARADIYAIGLVGWFLLTGRTAFRGKSVVEVCGHHLHTPAPRPSEVGVAVDGDLENVILRCLEKKPEDRFASADALRDALIATSVARGWTDGKAHRWWRGRTTTEEPVTASMEQTGVLAVDLDERSPIPDAAPERQHAGRG